MKKKQIIAALTAMLCWMSTISVPGMALTTAAKTTIDHTVQSELDSPVYGIGVSEEPDKTDYIIGEELDLTGLRLNGSYQIGELISCIMDEDYQELLNSNVPIKIDTSGFDNTKAGTYHIYVLYGDAKDSFKVTVYNDQLELSKNNTASSESIKGDVNGDGSFGVSDVVLLQKWLLAVPDTNLGNWKAADFCKDNKLNAFDLCLMKRALIEKLDIDPNDDPEIYELLFGYSNESSGKPLPTQRLALKCKSYCDLGDTLKVDVAIGDTYSYHQQYSGYPTYDTPGHAEYGIYACDAGTYKKIENEKLIINGEAAEYKKVYSKEELESLDISGKVADYESYHHETAEIDFSNFKTGDSGSIVFYFQWEYDEENPYDTSSNISGMSMIIGYYVGEKGVVIGAGAEDAQIRYQSMFG